MIKKVSRKATTLWLKTFQLEFICKSYDHTKFQTHLLPKEHGILNYCMFYL